MRSLMKNLFASHMRNPTAEDEDDYIFDMQSIPGGVLKDSITGVPAVTSISGTRCGIVNGVVTQFVANQPPIEDNGLRGCPAFTQLCKVSEDLTAASWSKNKILTPTIAGTFQGSNLWNIISSVETGTHSIIQTGGFTGVAHNSVIGQSFVFKSVGGMSIQLIMYAKDATYPVLANVSSSGVISEKNALAFVSVEDLGGGYFRILSAMSCGVGASNPYIYAQMYNGTTASFLGDGSSGFLMSQPMLINFGVSGVPFIPPYVPNNTTGSISVVSETAAAPTGTSFDLDDPKLARLKTALRGLNAQGHLKITIRSNTSSSWWLNSSVFNVLSVNNVIANLIYLNKDSGGIVSFRMTDGANAASVTQALSIGAEYNLSLDWGTHPTGQKMRLTVNGVKSALVNFSGSFGTQDLRFFYANTVHAGWIVKDSLKITDKPQW